MCIVLCSHRRALIVMKGCDVNLGKEVWSHGSSVGFNTNFAIPWSRVVLVGTAGMIVVNFILTLMIWAGLIFRKKLSNFDFGFRNPLFDNYQFTWLPQAHSIHTHQNLFWDDQLLPLYFLIQRRVMLHHPKAFWLLCYKEGS